MEFEDILGIPWRIHFGEDKITIDHNHPLAGETLIFEITIVNIG